MPWLGYGSYLQEAGDAVEEISLCESLGCVSEAKHSYKDLTQFAWSSPNFGEDYRPKSHLNTYVLRLAKLAQDLPSLSSFDSARCARFAQADKMRYCVSPMPGVTTSMRALRES
jgi:hypothetical protein